MRKYIILFLCTLLGVAAALSLPSFVSAVTPDISVMVAKPDNIETAVVCTGKIEAADSIEVKLSVPIKPDRLEVETGDRVKKGQLLFTVDKTATIEAVAGLSGSPETTPNISQNNDVSKIPDEVKAPVDGIITEVNVSSDRVTKASSVLMTIAKSDTLQVRMSISENMISSVKAGQKVIVTGNGFKGIEYAGRIKKVQSNARQTTSDGAQGVVVEAIAEIFSPDERIKPGFTAKVRIITDVGEGVIALPYETILQDEDNREFVYVVKENWIHKRYVETGRDTDAGVEILSGVQPGDLIVIKPDLVRNAKTRIHPVMESTNQ